MNKSSLNTEVIIVGNGISGLVLSVLLKAKGIDHILLSRTDKSKTIALSETLPPSTLPLLDSLNLLGLFSESSSKSFGYHSLWGSNTITDNNFFFHHPFNYGLKLNKSAVVHQLSERVSDHIIPFNSISTLDCNQENKVRVEVEQDGNRLAIAGKLIVDATGRNRVLIKKLNVEVKSYDDLVAFICHIPLVEHPRLKHKVFVESFENGWGIVSSLNEKTNVMTIFTKKGNSVFQPLKEYKNWEKVLASTEVLKDFLAPNSDLTVVGGNANSSKPIRTAGANWLAIGDAAMSFDPLSSHGVSNAVYCANASAKAIASYFKSYSTLPLQNYDKTINQIFDEYLKHKSKLYETENRWMENSFWKTADKSKLIPSRQSFV